MEMHPLTSESFLPRADHQPFSTTVVSTTMTATMATGIVQQTISPSLQSTPEAAASFAERSSSRTFPDNTRPDILTTTHQVASVLSTYDPDADPATLNSAVSLAITLLEREKIRREYPARRWTPSPVPFFGGQGILEPPSRTLHYRPLLTL